MITNKSKTIDFLFFINTQAIKRIVGYSPRNEKMANFLGVEIPDLVRIVKDDNQIRAALQVRFQVSGKDYILNASLPTTRKNTMVDTDHFQLLLGTNSIGVSDAFLKSYVEAIKEFKNI